MADEHLTSDELRERDLTEDEIAAVERIRTEGIPFPTRQTLYLVPPSDPLVAFFWARLDETERAVQEPRARHAVAPGVDVELPCGATIKQDTGATLIVEAGHGRGHVERVLADVAAKKAILDDYARRCADLDNPAREMECQLIRDVIKRLATVYAGHPDYRKEWKP